MGCGKSPCYRAVWYEKATLLVGILVGRLRRAGKQRIPAYLAANIVNNKCSTNNSSDKNVCVGRESVRRNRSVAYRIVSHLVASHLSYLNSLHFAFWSGPVTGRILVYCVVEAGKWVRLRYNVVFDVCRVHTVLLAIR